jgi:hypothetical protein
MAGGRRKTGFMLSFFPDSCSQVDPIVASFSGGAVGVLSSLMIVELNNVSLQEEKKCHYCKGSGKKARFFKLTAAGLFPSASQTASDCHLN